MSKTLTIAHNQWATRPDDQRFRTLDELHAAVKARRSLSREAVKDITELRAEADEDGNLFIGNGNRLEPTNWSFGQFASLVGAPAAFLRKLTPATTAVVLNERINAVKQSLEREDVKVVRVLAEDGDTLQAVTSKTYGRIWDADVVASVQKIVERTGGKFYNPKAYANGKFGAEPVPSGLYASDRDVFMFLVDGGSVFDVGPRAKFSRGVIVSNSEVGKSALMLMTFLFDHCCGNHYIYGAREINQLFIRHTAGGPVRFTDEAVPTLLEYTKADPDFTAIKRAQTILLTGIKPDGFIGDKVDDDWAKCFARQHGFAAGEIREAFEFARREEGKCETLFDLTQGLTAQAREIGHIDTRMDLERRGSKLLALAE